jgi:hypothetical protein
MRMLMAALCVGCGVVEELNYLSEPYLDFSIPSALKRSGCPNDQDGDCLDDAMEHALAAKAAPMMFLDNAERCADLGEYRVHPSFQVRPIGRAARPVEDWNEGWETEKVRVTYFLNWPLDCGYSTEKSHLGDSEHVTFELEGSDLMNWSLVRAVYRSHGDEYVIDGERIDDLADTIGATRPTIAVEGDKHGSWWGKNSGSDDCAGSEIDFGFGAIDCFADMSWNEAFERGEYFVLEVRDEMNIGEPPLGGATFRSPAVEKVIDGEGIERYRTSSQYEGSAGHLNHLGGSEYWWNAPKKFERFCGWVCADEDRVVDGCTERRFQILGGRWKDFDSRVDMDTAAECAGPLQEKIDRTPSAFRRRDRERRQTDVAN